jgi:uncharacterized protein (TIGR02246 family)
MRNRLLLCFAVALLLAGGVGVAQKDGEGKGKDGDAIFENAKAFVAAFDKGDVKALAAFWAEDGDYTDVRGRHVKGRAKIEAAFKETFADAKGLKLRIDSESLKFVTPDVAIEDGTTEVLHPDGGPPNKARYTIVHVKKGGKWLISSVRDADFSPPTNYDHLKGLEWLIGDWADEAGKGDVARVSFAWAKNQNFIVSNFHTAFKNITLGGGAQWIGYDPVTKKIRSWTFEFSGAFGEAVWSADGKSWTVKTALTTREGQRLKATNVITFLDANAFTFESKDRTLNGKELPPIKPIRMKRQK